VAALFVLIGISMVIGGSFLAAFLWSVMDGQYDDDYTPSVRILFDSNIKPAEMDSPTLKMNSQIDLSPKHTPDKLSILNAEFSNANHPLLHHPAAGLNGDWGKLSDSAASTLTQTK
jgi:cbb3-type cytochrome oxidase maturation protein